MAHHQLLAGWLLTNRSKAAPHHNGTTLPSSVTTMPTPAAAPEAAGPSSSAMDRPSGQAATPGTFNLPPCYQFSFLLSLTGNTRSKARLARLARAQGLVEFCESPTKWEELGDLRESDLALPDKNVWNEESPTAGKSGKRPQRGTPPSRQSSLYYRRRARSGKAKLGGKWARIEARARPSNSPSV